MKKQRLKMDKTEDLELMELQELALKRGKRLSAEPIQQKQGLRENNSTSARDKN